MHRSSRRHESYDDEPQFAGMIIFGILAVVLAVGLTLLVAGLF